MSAGQIFGLEALTRATEEARQAVLRTLAGSTHSQRTVLSKLSDEEVAVLIPGSVVLINKSWHVVPLEGVAPAIASSGACAL